MIQCPYNTILILPGGRRGKLYADGVVAQEVTHRYKIVSTECYILVNLLGPVSNAGVGEIEWCRSWY